MKTKRNKSAWLNVAALPIMLVLTLTLLSTRAALPDQPLLHLKYAVFDPLSDEPKIPARLRLSKKRGDSSTMRLLQFAGPVRDEWKSAVEETETRLYDYVPDYAFLVRIDRATEKIIETMPFVRWVGPYHPAYRLAPALRKPKPTIATSQPVTLTVQTLPDADLQGLAMQVKAMGGTVQQRSSNDLAGHLRVSLAPDRLADLAALDGVVWIEPYVEPEVSNSRAGIIMRVPQVRTNLGLYGNGQIVAVADTGLDVGHDDSSLHDDFEGRIVTAYAPADLFSFCLREDWSDADGHGTHVAGSVLGSGVRSESDPANHEYWDSFAGMAPEAGLIVQALDDTPNDPGLECIPSDLTQHFQQAYVDGARIHSNSWGFGNAGVYDLAAHDADQFAWQHKDATILFAAGNDGSDRHGDGQVDPDSMESPATAKNVIAVGASENLRNSGGYNPGGVCSTWGSCWPSDFPVSPIAGDRLSDRVEGMAAFSSRGPADDGRIKPDLVSPGTNVISVQSQHPDAGTGWGAYTGNYAYQGGTSMSTPLTAGAAAIVREWYNDIKDLSFPSSALIKATLIHGATELTPGQYYIEEGSGPTVLSEGFEGTLDDWSLNTSEGAQWSKVSPGHASGTAMRSSASGPYPNNADIQMWTTSGYNLAGITNPVLTFWHYYSLEENYDFGWVGVSTDGGFYYDPVARFSGTAADWGQAQVDLTPYGESPNVRIKFQLISDSTLRRPGWYIDDVSIRPRGQVLREIRRRPNNVEGWGRVDLWESIRPAPPREIWYRDNAIGLSSSDSVAYTVTIGSAQAVTEALKMTQRSARETLQVDRDTSSQLVQNPGFESSRWTPWQLSGNPYLDNSVAHAGSWSGHLGDSNNANDQFWQEVHIPTNAAEITIGFWLRLETREILTGDDILSYGIWDNTGESALIRKSIDFGESGDLDWTQKTYSLSPTEVSSLAGQTVLLKFSIDTDIFLTSRAWVDDVTLDVTSPGGSPTRTPTPTLTATPVPTPASGGPLRLTLVWTDYPGSPLASKALVNDLDLEVIVPDGTHVRGNEGLYSSGQCLRSGGWDTCNNIEGITIPEAPYGDYVIRVRGINVPEGPQPFALMASGDYLRDEGTPAPTYYFNYQPLILRSP